MKGCNQYCVVACIVITRLGNGVAELGEILCKNLTFCACLALIYAIVGLKLLQESLADAKISTRQQCVYEGH